MAYQVGLMEWAEACKIVTDRPSMAQRTLDAAHEELLEKGFLKRDSRGVSYMWLWQVHRGSEQH